MFWHERPLLSDGYSTETGLCGSYLIVSVVIETNPLPPNAALCIFASFPFVCSFPFQHYDLILTIKRNSVHLLVKLRLLTVEVKMFIELCYSI